MEITTMSKEIADQLQTLRQRKSEVSTELGTLRSAIQAQQEQLQINQVEFELGNVTQADLDKIRDDMHVLSRDESMLLSRLDAIESGIERLSHELRKETSEQRVEVTARVKQKAEKDLPKLQAQAVKAASELAAAMSAIHDVGVFSITIENQIRKLVMGDLSAEYQQHAHSYLAKAGGEL